MIKKYYDTDCNLGFLDGKTVAIMGYGSQKGHKQMYNGVDFGGNLLPKVKVESIVSDETYENIIDQIIEEINTGVYGDGKIFVYEVADAIRIRTGERGDEAL